MDLVRKRFLVVAAKPAIANCWNVPTRGWVVVALRVVATVPVYNEADIIGQVLEHLHEHGILFVGLDGGSDDGSVEVAQGFRGMGLLEHRIVKRDVYEWSEDLECLIKMATMYSPDWILCNDADEFLEPRERGRTLHDAITAEHQLGFNIVQFDNFEFYLTERDYESKEPDIRKRMRFYRWSDDYRYKAWKYYPGATCRDSGGHYPVLPRSTKPMVSPRKFVVRHYPLRSPQQAMRKIFKDRLPRYAAEERAKGWHLQYDHLKEDLKSFVYDSTMLSEYDGTGRWDMTKRPLPGPNWESPTREELFGQSSLLRVSLRCRRLLRNACTTPFVLYLFARKVDNFRRERARQ
jgi:glycosyltransferase involved in cell wall biosynthesis